MTAEEYIAKAPFGDCLQHARAIAALLAAGGKKPWIGCLRKIEQRAEGTFHHPLIPRNVPGPKISAWTTHYVCCCDGRAYDPLLGRSEPLETYATTLFGLEIPITEIS